MEEWIRKPEKMMETIPEGGILMKKSATFHDYWGSPHSYSEVNNGTVSILSDDDCCNSEGTKHRRNGRLESFTSWLRKFSLKRSRQNMVLRNSVSMCKAWWSPSQM